MPKRNPFIDRLIDPKFLLEVAVILVGVVIAWSAFDKRLAIIESKMDGVVALFNKLENHESRLTVIETSLSLTK